MLSDRRQQILRALIEEYVSHAMPVGSRTLTEQYHLGVSSATVRNELSALEEAGYITQPHTSAGRIPTDAGYREFVDDLLASDIELVSKVNEEIVARMRKSADKLDQLMEQTSAELARLTDCLSIITPPSFNETPIRQVSLISLSNRQAVAVIVFDDSQVANRNIVFDDDVSAQDLAKIEQVLSAIFQGRAFKDCDPNAAFKLEDRLQGAASVAVDEISQCLRESGSIAKPSRLGLSSLMRKPEFQESSALLPLMEILEDDTVIFKVFQDAVSSENDLSIRIGHENVDANLLGVSVIAGVYGRGSAQGVVAVIGPKRMDYENVIKAVKAAQDALADR